jgi:hypothetical protein
MTKCFEIFLDLNIIPGRTESFCDELPIARPMARRTPYGLLSEDLPPVRRMGNRSPNSTYWWLTIFILGPNIHLGRTVSHQTLVSNELPLGFPLVHMSKRQAPVSPKILPMGKKLRPTPGVSSRHNHPTRNPAEIDIESSGRQTKDTPFPIPRQMAMNDREILPMPRKVIHRVPPQGRGDNAISRPNLGLVQPQKMTPQRVTLPLYPSSYSPAVYDSTNPEVESSYINYTEY